METKENPRAATRGEEGNSDQEFSGVNFNTSQAHSQKPKWRTDSDFIAEFASAMEASGIGLPDGAIEADGKIHRFRGENDRKGCKNAWYVVHLDARPAGAFGSWRTGVSRTLVAEGGKAMDPAEAARIRRQVADAKAAREAEQLATWAATAQAAEEALGRARSADKDHPYLVAKAVPPAGIWQRGNELLVPMQDIDGRLWNLQRIFPSGLKLFLKGGRVTGCFAMVGDTGRAPARLLIAEGWATAATLHQAMKLPVLAAMNAGNLIHVCRAARGRWPAAKITLCGDDDRGTPGNPGRTKATEAAAAIGGLICFPPFRDDEPGSDFNDFYQLRGRQAVHGDSHAQQ